MDPSEKLPVSISFEHATKDLQELCASEINLQAEIHSLQNEIQRQLSASNNSQLLELSGHALKLKDKCIEITAVHNVNEARFEEAIEKNKATNAAWTEITKKRDKMLSQMTEDMKKSTEDTRDIDKNKSNIKALIEEEKIRNANVLKEKDKLLSNRKWANIEFAKMADDELDINVDGVIEPEIIKKLEEKKYEEEINKMIAATHAVKRQIDYLITMNQRKK